MASVYFREDRGIWYVRWRDGLGRLQRRATTAKTRREAQGLLAELAGQAQRVKLGLEAAPAESKLTLQQLLEWWLAERCPEASREMAGRQLGKHVLKTELALYPLPLITADNIETKVLEAMEKAGSAPATVNKVRGYLHAAFAAARRPPKKWAGQNPVTETRSRTVPKKEKTTLTPEQVARLLEQVPEAWRGTCAVAAYLGLRRGEIYALKKSDYSRERQELQVFASHQRDTTKTGRRDTLPVPSIVRPYLERARRTPGFFLFPAPDGTQRTKEADPHLIVKRACGRIGLALLWKSYCLTCKRAGRPNEELTEKRPEPTRCPVDGHLRRVKVAKHWPVNFHGLRHTCATNLLRAGVPMAHVSKIIRHASIKLTVDTYGHLVADDLRAALESQSSPQALTARTPNEHQGGEAG
jgi:integrase